MADIIINGTKQEAEVIDLIKEPDKIKKVQFKEDDVCLVSVPSYGGRIPSVITEMFQNVKADGTKAITSASCLVPLIIISATFFVPPVGLKNIL